MGYALQTPMTAAVSTKFMQRLKNIGVWNTTITAMDKDAVIQGRPSIVIGFNDGTVAVQDIQTNQWTKLHDGGFHSMAAAVGVGNYAGKNQLFLMLADGAIEIYDFALKSWSELQCGQDWGFWDSALVHKPNGDISVVVIESENIANYNGDIYVYNYTIEHGIVTRGINHVKEASPYVFSVLDPIHPNDGSFKLVYETHDGDFYRNILDIDSGNISSAYDADRNTHVNIFTNFVSGQYNHNGIVSTVFLHEYYYDDGYHHSKTFRVLNSETGDVITDLKTACYEGVGCLQGSVPATISDNKIIQIVNNHVFMVNISDGSIEIVTAPNTARLNGSIANLQNFGPNIGVDSGVALGTDLGQVYIFSTTRHTFVDITSAYPLGSAVHFFKPTVSNGQSILLAVLNNSDMAVYNFATKQWSLSLVLPNSNINQMQIVSMDTQQYILTAFSDGSLKAYNLQTNQWSILGGFVSGINAMQIYGHKVFIGLDNSALEMYDMDTQTWVQIWDANFFGGSVTHMAIQGNLLVVCLSNGIIETYNIDTQGNNNWRAYCSNCDINTIMPVQFDHTPQILMGFSDGSVEVSAQNGVWQQLQDSGWRSSVQSIVDTESVFVVGLADGAIEQYDKTNHIWTELRRFGSGVNTMFLGSIGGILYLLVGLANGAIEQYFFVNKQWIEVHGATNQGVDAIFMSQNNGTDCIEAAFVDGSISNYNPADSILWHTIKNPSVNISVITTYENGNNDNTVVAFDNGDIQINNLAPLIWTSIFSLPF
jgi:hypothetical protein